MTARTLEQEQVSHAAPGAPASPGPCNLLPAVLQLSVGREVRKWRRYRDLNGADLSKAAGISFGMLSRIESGSVTPSLTTLQSLASALGVPISSFFRSCGKEKSAIYTERSKAFTSATDADAAQYIPILSRAAGKNGTVISAHLIRMGGENSKYKFMNKGGNSFLFLLHGELLCEFIDEIHKLQAGDSILTDNKEAIFVTASEASQGLVLCVDVRLEVADQELSS